MWTAKDGLATQLWLRDEVSGEAESLSVSTEAFVGALPGPMTVVMYSHAANKGDAKKTWESNSLSLLLTSFLRGAVAAVPERTLSLVPGRARERAGGCPLPGDCGSHCQQIGHCRCCGYCSGHETEVLLHSRSHKAAGGEKPLPLTDQGTPEDPTAQEAGPDLPRGRLFPSFKRSVGGMRCCRPVRAVGGEPQDFCSSQLCGKPAPQTRSILLPELLLFSS